MGKKASNYLPFFFLLGSFFLGAQTFALNAFDLELNDAVQKKDWPSVVLLLQPKKGQNFEHDLTLAKALLSLERRQEAMKLLVSLQEIHKDERLNHLLQSAGTIFFNQETSNFYYEGLELIREIKFPEAKDRLEQGLAKEPYQILLLTRLIQAELALGQKDAAAGHLKLALSVTNAPLELKLFNAKLETDAQVAIHPSGVPSATPNTTNGDENSSASSDEESVPSLYQQLSPLKNQLFENEVTAVFWLEALKISGKTKELEILAQKTLKDHPLWTYDLMWTLQNAELAPEIKSKLDGQIEKNLKNKDSFNRTLDLETKKSDDLWVGYVNYEALVLQWAALHPKPLAK